MTVTIHANPPSDLYQLVRDLQTLEGSGNPYKVRRAVHGSGAIVDDDLALAWLMLTAGGNPEFLESLLRTEDEALEDLVGRRAPQATLQALYSVLAENEANAAFLDSVQSVSVESEPIDLESPTALEVPAKRAPKSEWEEWAVESGLVSAEQGAVMTKAQLQELDGPPTLAAPEEGKEG